MLNTGQTAYAMSVVIPVRDGARVIGRCLQAFAEGGAGAQGCEVIVADNGSKDDTLSVVKSFAGKLDLRMVSVPGVRVSAVRIAGAAHARGVLLAFVDADCVVGRNWIRLAIAHPWEERSGAIGSFFSAGSDATWVARVWSRFENSGKHGPVSLLPAGNMIVPRSVFEAVRGFDETLESNEDAEFCDQLTARGLRIEVVPGLEAVHLGAPQTVRALWRREVWHGSDVLLVFLRSGMNARAAAFAFYTLFWAVALFAAAAWGLATGDYRFFAAPIAAITAASAVIGVRSVRRTREWRDLAPLTLLLAVYGIARAVALVGSLGRVWHRNAMRAGAASGVGVNGQ
jgi:glycosyltransferase involved in cell wall biosynthesis